MEISIYERAADSGRGAVICSQASFAKIMTGAIQPTGRLCVCVCVCVYAVDRQAEEKQGRITASNRSLVTQKHSDLMKKVQNVENTNNAAVSL